jgi:hypothetical protein
MEGTAVKHGDDKHSPQFSKHYLMEIRLRTRNVGTASMPLNKMAFEVSNDHSRYIFK